MEDSQPETALRVCVCEKVMDVHVRDTHSTDGLVTDFDSRLAGYKPRETHCQASGLWHRTSRGQCCRAGRRYSPGTDLDIERLKYEPTFDSFGQWWSTFRVEFLSYEGLPCRNHIGSTNAIFLAGTSRKRLYEIP